jgi:hypothetical protein
MEIKIKRKYQKKIQNTYNTDKTQLTTIIYSRAFKKIKIRAVDVYG